MSETPSTNYSVTQPHISESEQSLSPRPLNVTDPIVAKRICFYKSGDPQFNGVNMVVNNRSFKSFDALLDNLSKRVPLPFGVRTITTPRGIHGITNLEDLEDGKSYICSQQKKIKPINLEKASKKPLPWQISRPVSARRKAVQLAREGEDGMFQRGGNVHISTPKKLLVFKNGDVRVRRTIVLGKKNTQNFEAFLDNISELMQYPVVKLYTTDGRKVPNLQALILCSGAVVAAGREPFRAGNYDPHRYSLPGRLPGISNRVHPKTNAKSEGRKNSSSRSQIFSTSSYKGYSNGNDSASSYVPDRDIGLAENHSHGGEELHAIPSEDDIEKSVHLNQDGSMTVEMRVRFKIKEDETIKWTTTVSRAGFSNDGNVKTSASAVIAEDQSSELNVLTCKNIAEDSNSAEENAADQQISEEGNNERLETCNYDIWQNSSMNIESDNDKAKPHFYRPPTPGPRRVRKKKALVESVTMVSDTAVQKEMVEQFSYSEETDTGETKSEYCLVTHSSSKTSNNDLKLRKTSSNQVTKQSLEDEVEEEMLNKVHHQTTIERLADLPDEDGLLQNILDKSAVKETSHNCVTSDCGLGISHVESSLRNCHASEEDLANQSGAMVTELKHSEWSQSKKEEIICSNQDRSSHCSIHPCPDENNQTECHYAKITTTMTESFVIANNSNVECITTHLSDESQAVSSSCKKKKKKKKRKSSSDIRDQGEDCQHRLHDIPMEVTVENGVKVCEMHVTKDATLQPFSQITAHEGGLENLVHNTNGSYRRLDAEEDLDSQVSMNHQQNESDHSQNLDSQLPKVKCKSNKKINVLPSQEGLLLEKNYSKNEIEDLDSQVSVNNQQNESDLKQNLDSQLPKVQCKSDKKIKVLPSQEDLLLDKNDSKNEIEDLDSEVSMNHQQNESGHSQNLDSQLPKVKCKSDKKINVLPSQEGLLLGKNDSKNEIEDLDSQVAMNHQQNDSDLKQNLDSQLPKVKCKSDKKINVLPSQDNLLLDKNDSKNEIEGLDSEVSMNHQQNESGHSQNLDSQLPKVKYKSDTKNNVLPSQEGLLLDKNDSKNEIEDLDSQVSMNHQENEYDLKQNLDSQLPKVKLKSDKKINVLPSQEDLLLDENYSKNEIEDLDSQVSMNHQQNESELKQNLDIQLPKEKIKSDKKIYVLPSQDLLLDKNYSKNEVEHISEDTHDSTSIKEQTPFGITPLNPLNETGSGCKEETEKRKSCKQSIKHKKVRKNRKTECSPRSQAKMFDDHCAMDAFRHVNETVEHSLESYVQSWLQNIFPWAVTPVNSLSSINSNERTMHPLSDTSFSDKENQLERKNEYLMGKNNTGESNLSNSTLNHLNETGIVEESVKDFHEKHIGCLTGADASIIDDTKSDIYCRVKQSLCDIVHANDSKNPLESDSQCLSDDQRFSSEIGIQADPKAIDSMLATNVQIDSVSSLLLHQLKSAVFNFEKSHNRCIEKSCCLTNISPSLLGSSSDLLLAWLLVQNFKESLSSMNNDDIGQTTCNFSEIVTLQQYLKQVIAKEEAKDLENEVSNQQECTENHLEFSGMQTETQEPTYCQDNIFPVDTGYISGFEAQGKLSKTLNSNDRLDSDEVTDANKLTENLDSSSKSQDNCSTLTDNPSLDDLDNHYVLQDLNCDNACHSSNCELTSNEELLEDNEDTSALESLDRNTDTSFNNEESGLSEEPKSTTYSLTSNNRGHIFDLETSELEENDLKSIEEQEQCTESLEKEENLSEHFSLAAKNAANGSKDNSVQECLEERCAFEEPPEQLATCSPSSFCNDLKKNPVDASVEEPISRVKLMVKELESGSYSNSPSELKRYFKHSAASDLSGYPPDSDRSEYSHMPSSDLTSGSTEESIFEKSYNRGFVKRTIERLYGKSEAPFKPVSKLGPPYVSQMSARDTEESFHSVVEEASSLCQASHSSSSLPSSLTSHEILEEVNRSNIWEEENVTRLGPQFSLNEEDAWYNEESLVQYTNQYCQSEAHTTEDEGVLIDKGKWLLKKNHLIRKSPPENLEMYGNIETTSAETMVETHSDDIPYPHLGNLDLKPPLKEISSSEMEDMAKPFNKGCSYFNRPHNSESEPFPDELSIKSRHSQYGSTLPVEATRKKCTTPTQPCTVVNTSISSFRSIEFRLPDNKVHPLEQPSHEETHLTQPTSNTYSNRISHEDQDSLDKLHAICGQHCPILIAIVKPANEEVRGCAYRKASDIENQLGIFFLMNTLNLRWQGKDVTKFDNKHVNLKNSCINTITNNILNRFYADNTLEFMNENNLQLLMSAAPKENKNLDKLCTVENMDVDAKELSNNQIHATKEIFREITDQCHNVSVFQISRSNANHVAGAEPAQSPADVTEGCEDEISYSYEMFLNNTGQNESINLEDANTADVTEEINSPESEEESSNNNSKQS